MSLNSKKSRDAAGFTLDTVGTNPENWLRNAEQFHSAAKLLCSDNSDSTPLPYYYSAGLSIELLLKAIAVKRGSTPKKTHNLNRLCDACAIQIENDQKLTLELLTEIIIWQGKYPVPMDDSAWDNYYDSIHEKHIQRSREGNTFITRANPKTFPTLQNYLSIWKTLLDLY